MRRRYAMKTLLAGALMVLLSLVILPSAATAATLTVSTTKDQLEDIGNTINDCSLREAIISVNTGKNMFGCSAVGVFGSNDTITLPAGKYELTHFDVFVPPEEIGNLVIRRPVTIQGAGAASTIVDGAPSRNLDSCGGVLRVDDGDDATRRIVTISGLTVRNGLAVAGRDCPHSSLAGQNAGGGIYNREALTLISVVVEDNEAGVGFGAGSSGGGIFNDGRLELLDSVVRNNTARESGAGVMNFFGGELLIEQSTIEGNASFPAGLTFATGGGVHNLGTATIRTSTVRNNSSATAGGGIVNGSGAMTILFSTISGNSASDFAGGGILHSSDGTLTIMNSTISGNSSGDAGGGIFAESGVVALSSVTITDNQAAQGGGVQAFGSADVRVENSLIAGNRDTAGTSQPDCSGTFDSFGFNLIGNVSGCSGFTRISDKKGTAASPLDPLLGPLAGNTGPTKTHLPLLGSPVIDAGGVVQPPPELLLDQRGLSRPQDGDGNGNSRFDIGAVELAPTLEPSADVSVILADDVDPVAEGGIVTYTLRLRNDGPGIADSAVASASVLGGTVINSGSCNFDGASGVRCLLGDLFPGEEATRSFVVVAAGAGEVTVSAEVVSDRGDADLSDNSAQETTQVVAADVTLELTLDESTDPVEAGQVYSYTMRIENTGSDGAGQVTLIGTLAGGAVLGALPVGCSEDTPTTVRCTISGLGPNESNTRTVEVIAPSAPAIVEFEVAAQSAFGDPVQARISTTVLEPEADLAITKVGPNQVQVDQEFSYTIAVENLDADDASGPLLVEDTLAAELSFVSATSSAFNCNAVGREVTCSASALDPGRVALITLTVRAPSVPSDVANRASVSSRTTDPDPANNVSEIVNTSVTAAPPPPVADLLLLVQGPVSVAGGEVFRYELTVVNSGTATAREVSLADVLPAEATFSAASNGCQRNDRLVTCEVGALPGGESRSGFIEVVAPIFPVTLVNTARVSSPTDDPDPGNNEVTVETEVDDGGVAPGLVFEIGPNTPTDVEAGPGDSDIPVLQVVATVSGNEDVALSSFTIEATSDGNDLADLTTVKLFADRNGDGRVGVEDTLLASGGFTGDGNELSLTTSADEALIPAGGSLSLLLAVDVGSSVPLASLLSLGLLGFGLRMMSRYRRCWLVVALFGMLLVSSCATQAPPPRFETVTYQLTITTVEAVGIVGDAPAQATGLPLSSTRFGIRKQVLVK